MILWLSEIEQSDRWTAKKRDNDDWKQKAGVPHAADGYEEDAERDSETEYFSRGTMSQYDFGDDSDVHYKDKEE